MGSGEKYSNSLMQHRRTRNLNVPLPQFHILLSPSFLRHLINQVAYVYINTNKHCCMLRPVACTHSLSCDSVLSHCAIALYVPVYTQNVN